MMPQFMPTHLFSAYCPTQRHARRVPRPAGHGAERARHGQLQRGRGGEPRAHRHVAGHHALPAGGRVTVLLQRPGHPAHVVGPRAGPPGQVIEVEGVALPEIQRVDRHLPVARRPQRDPGRPINGHRQHEAIVVIGVLADQVDAAGRPHHEGRRRTVKLLKGLDYLLINAPFVSP